MFSASSAPSGRPLPKRSTPSTRLVITRIGIVLAADGGALGKMLPIFRAGFGGPIGSGQQWMSWIARTDLCGLIAAALTDEAFAGIYNATAPNPVSMREFLLELGRALRRPSLLPVPGAVLKLLLGDGASGAERSAGVAAEVCRLSSLLFRRHSWIDL